MVHWVMMPLGTSQVIAIKRPMKLKRDQLTFPATLSSRDTTKYSMLSDTRVER